MYILYEFFPSYVVPLSGAILVDVWISVGKFSQLVDAETQKQMLIDQGIPSNYLRILTDQDPVPSDIPSP